MVSQRILKIALLAVLSACLLVMAGDTVSGVRATGDLDGDGNPEAYALIGHRLTVREGSRILWRSDPDWRVDSFALGDVDNDGTRELVLSLWKTGSFGALKPFWHEGEDTSYKNHLFVFQLREDTVHPAWCSSDLARPIVSFAVRDTDGDGLNEHITGEGEYRRVEGERYALDTDSPTRTTVWQWEEWGFYREQPDS
jgi:hypothetical protein